MSSLHVDSSRKCSPSFWHSVFDSLPNWILQIRSQLDDAVASDCPFCGDLMIREISLPFILPEEAEESESWEIKPHNHPSQRSLSLAV